MIGSPYAGGIGGEDAQDYLQEQLRESNMTIASLRLELQSLRAKNSREREDRERERREREEEEAKMAALHVERTARAVQLAAQVAALTLSPSRPSVEATTAPQSPSMMSVQSPALVIDPICSSDTLNRANNAGETAAAPSADASAASAPVYTFRFEQAATAASGTAKSPKKPSGSPASKGKRRSTSSMAKLAAAAEAPASPARENLLDPPAYFSSPVAAPRAPAPTPFNTPAAKVAPTVPTSSPTTRGGVVVLPSPKGVMLSARMPEGYHQHASEAAPEIISPPSGSSWAAATGATSANGNIATRTNSSPHHTAKTVRISTAPSASDQGPIAARGLETLKAELPRVFDELVLIKRMLEEQLQQQNNKTY